MEKAPSVWPSAGRDLYLRFVQCVSYIETSAKYTKQNHIFGFSETNCSSWHSKRMQATEKGRRKKKMNASKVKEIQHAQIQTLPNVLLKWKYQERNLLWLTQYLFLLKRSCATLSACTSPVIVILMISNYYWFFNRRLKGIIVLIFENRKSSYKLNYTCKVVHIYMYIYMYM